ncbi:MAG TPA: hypothetical protein VJN93_09955 [Candidatus Acidoferrum sp.]|nr:hypothetical protein [Candidatus Acidoferrum sp.]
MKGNWKAGAVLSGFAMLLSASVWARQQSKSEQKTAPAKQQSAEMARLNFYLGEWDYTETYLKSAAFPNGGQNTGIYMSKAGPGGNSLVNSFHSHGPVGDFEGLLVMTWDPREKCYKMYAFGGDLPGALEETGQFEGDALVYHIEMKMGTKSMKLRNVTRLAAPGKIVSEQFAAQGDGPETLMVHVEATKR